MAIGDRTYFGYQPDPNLTSPLANLTDNSRRGHAGSTSTPVDLADTGDMPDGIYKFRMDFSILNVSGTGTYPYIDGGTVLMSLGHAYPNNYLLGQFGSREGILRVDKGVGSKITMKYPSGWHGLVVTFQYIGALT